MTNSHQAGSTPADVMVTTNRVEVVDGTVPAPAPADPGPGEPHGGGEGGGTKPPVILFLPGLSTLGHNTTVRLADVMCANLTRGPGTFAVRSLDTSAGALSDGRRIVEADEASVLDLYTVQFPAEASGRGAAARGARAAQADGDADPVLPAGPVAAAEGDPTPGQDSGRQVAAAHRRRGGAVALRIDPRHRRGDPHRIRCHRGSPAQRGPRRRPRTRLDRRYDLADHEGRTDGPQGGRDGPTTARLRGA